MMMHAVDTAIFDGTVTAQLVAAHAALPLPEPGHSYWADRMREGHSPLVSARLAALDMGTVLAALEGII